MCLTFLYLISTLDICKTRKRKQDASTGRRLKQTQLDEHSASGCVCVTNIRKQRQAMHIPVDGDVGRHGSVQSGIFRPKLVHLLLGCRSHRSSAAENSRENQHRNSDLTSQQPEGS